MLIHEYTDKRENKRLELNFDLVVVGGGMSGVCGAIAAARAGIKVALVQDRPVLGGNASSEVRLWVLGATSHMGNNNRWSREGGVIDEILVENTFRNKEGNPVLFDMVLLDKVLAEKNISLFLNTIVHSVNKRDRRICSVVGFNPQNQTEYIFNGELFADCSGDGIVAHNAGASFRVGAETKEEFGEKFAPDPQIYGEMLGHSIFFYTKDVGKPVDYVAPDFALKDVHKHIPRIDNRAYLNPDHHGCKYWWLEYGGRLDTVHDTEQIKYELLKVVYGVWDYIKNSGKFPQTRTQTLEWVGTFAGKRESRRFAGYYTLCQEDVIRQRSHYDAVAYGGWSIDLHPSDGVYSPMNGCNQWHSKGVYQIPYRCYVSCDVENLFLGGRIMSATHVAHGSSRVMCTCAHGAQAIGMAAALCIGKGVDPAYYCDPQNIPELQQRLIAIGHHIPMLDMKLKGNLLSEATIEASSELKIAQIRASGEYEPIDYSIAQLIPLNGAMPDITVDLNATEPTSVLIEIRTSEMAENFTPDTLLESKTVELKRGSNRVKVDFDCSAKGYVFVCIMKNPAVSIAMSDQFITGVTTVYNIVNEAVSNFGKQTPPSDIGVDEFEFWCPKRRPESRLIAMGFEPALEGFSADNLRSDIYRPVVGSNAWVAAMDDQSPSLTFKWSERRRISNIRLFFDTDFDHAMENVQMGHYDSVMPHCTRNFEIFADLQSIAFVKDNYSTSYDLPTSVNSSYITIKFGQSLESVPVSLMGVIIT